MDTSNHGASGAVGDVTMKFGDWRTQPQRERIVNKLMDTLKKNLPFSRYDRLQELTKIAERVEQEIFAAATSQSEYSRRICLHMLTMETRLQYTMSDPTTSAPSDSTQKVLYIVSNGGDWQDEVYQKIKTMKDLYLLDMGFSDVILEPGDWRVQLRAYSRLRTVNKITDTLKRCLPLSGHEELHHMAMVFEKKIYTNATNQAEYLRKISLKMLLMEARYNPGSIKLQ